MVSFPLFNNINIPETVLEEKNKRPEANNFNIAEIVL